LPHVTDPIVSTIYGFIYQVVYYMAFLILAIIVYVATWWLLKHSRLGLCIRIHGSNPSYLQSIGVSPALVILTALAIQNNAVMNPIMIENTSIETPYLLLNAESMHFHLIFLCFSFTLRGFTEINA